MEQAPDGKGQLSARQCMNAWTACSNRLSLIGYCAVSTRLKVYSCTPLGAWLTVENGMIHWPRSNTLHELPPASAKALAPTSSRQLTGPEMLPEILGHVSTQIELQFPERVV